LRNVGKTAWRGTGKRLSAKKDLMAGGCRSRYVRCKKDVRPGASARTGRISQSGAIGGTIADPLKGVHLADTG